ncbi:MAG: glycerate 2-kinase [Eubacteriaceae bacterium]|nr:glycerate 2-kinase [Eubacteriaceae bacterium]
MRIKNMTDLLSHGDIKGRKDILEILEAGLQAADPYVNMCKLMRLEGSKLIIGGASFEYKDDPQIGVSTYDLNDIEHIWVVGAGKGIQRVAKAIEDILGEHLTGGEIILKHGDQADLSRINVTYGAHPVPDEGCVEGCKKIYELSKKVTQRDLVFTIVANGVSSLLTLPVPQVKLEDVRKVTSIMQIEKGVPTEELNKIRNHLDLMKGGRISRYFQKAQMIHLIVIDINGKVNSGYYGSYENLMHNNIWLHNLPEASSFQDAIDVLKRWGAWDDMPESIRIYLKNPPAEHETVKYDEFQRFRFRVFGVMPEELSFLLAAKKKAEELGYNTHILTRWLHIEASQAGLYSASIAQNIEAYQEPFKPPCCLLTGGELLVTCGKNPGVGGRNQEYVLAAATQIAGSKKCVIAAVDTDGTDGPGGFIAEDAPQCLAGGIVDGMTLQEAREQDIDIHQALKTHATSTALWKLKSGIVIEHNISLTDLGVILIHD